VGYALNVARDASRVIAELPIDVQEDVWDLLERIAAEPRSPRAATGLSGSIHKYYHTATTPHLMIEFAVIIDDATRAVFVPRLEYVVP
jgi:hypothetical protein